MNSTNTRLILLHGAPAVGKLTIANAIGELIDAALVDNHVLIDFAKSVMKFGAPGFFDLVRAARILALRHAVKNGVPLIVFTSCFSDPEDRPQLEELESVLPDPLSQLLPVFLHCPEPTQHKRVGGADRAERGKLTSVEGLEKFQANWNFVPIPRVNCLSVDTSELSPGECAGRILAHFGLHAQ